MARGRPCGRDRSDGSIRGSLDRNPAMSGSPEDPVSRPPRRARPAPDAASGPPPGRGVGDPEVSTFRPNPAGSAGVAKSRVPKRGGAAGRDAGYERPEAGPRRWERILFGRVSSGQLAQFARHFASYLKAGVDITRA